MPSQLLFPMMVRKVTGGSPVAFADSVEKIRSSIECDVLFSLERIWRCDCYRAGDGVHRAWLDRRAAGRGLTLVECDEGLSSPLPRLPRFEPAGPPAKRD